MEKYKSLILLVYFSSLGAGCSFSPEARVTPGELPGQWTALPAPAETLQTGQWWTLYGDATLAGLVEEALAHNQDLALATARVDEARALTAVADAALVPAVDATAQRERLRLSDRSATRLPAGTPLERNNYRARINVAYEIDLWGRLRSSAQAARAELQASAAARETVRIALTAQVVQSYYTLRALDTQVTLAHRALQLRDDDLRLQQVRVAAGLADDGVLRRAEADIAAARARLPLLERRRSGEELALGVLLGRSPRALFESAVARGSTGEAPAAAVVPAGLPSALLLRRPDIIGAEQQLVAAQARIGAARASLFPRIALSGNGGSESLALGDLFSGPARIWSLGLGLAQPVFQGGRLFGEIEAVEARERQALARYRMTLQNAFGEVQDALIAQSRAREALEAASSRAAALEAALHRVRIRHDSGLTSRIEVLEAEGRVLDAEFDRAEALGRQRAAVADVVRALGGGWEQP
jgi:multidrug efflux system outer membrane protein